MKKLRTFLSLLLSVLMLAAFLLPSAALATDDPTAGGAVDGSKTASPNLLCSAQPQTTVTLSLPSAERHYVYDIVFVMDSSSSTVNSNIDFGVQVKSLCDALIEKDATIKVGVIKCRGRAFDTISLASSGAYSGLVEYSEETSAAILAGIQFTESDLKELSSGTNMHGGLKLADDWLTKDKAVPDSHKFVILLMDGKTYIWNNEADEPTSYYTQYQNSSGPKGTPQVGQQTGAYAKSAYKHKDGYFYNYSTADAHIPGSSCVTVSDMTKCFYTPFYSEIYNSDNAELGDTETKYDSYCYYADKKGSSASGTLTTHTTTNGATFTYNIHKNYYEFVPGINTTYNVDYTGLNWLEAAPYEVINVDGSYSYDFAEPNPDFYQVHPDSLQKALYLTGHLWTDLTAKYNSAAIIYSGWGGGSGLELAKSFDEWILGAEISDYAAELTTAYDPNNPPSDPEEAAAAEAAAIADAAAVGAMFDSISEEILYMIASGTVTDVIPDEFKLVKNGTDTFRMTLNGEALAATADGESAWNFGESVEEKYPYRVEYDEAGKEISWIINVPVENAKPVTLSYDLEIAEDALPGEHDTNVSAVLAYTGSVDESGVSESGEYTFEIPTVTYTGRIQVVKTFEGISEDQVRQLMDKFQINIEPVQDPDAEAGNEPTRGTALEAGDKPADDFTIDPLTLEDAATEDGKTFTWMVEVPVGDYTVSELENSADVAGYTLITEETEDSEPSVTKANVTVTEKNNIENPASAELTNVYEQDIGTLEITKTFDKIPAELIAEDDFVESFEIAVTDAAAEADAAAGNNGDVKPLYTLTLGDQGVKPDDDGLSFKWTLDDVPTGNYTVKENMPESYGGYTLDVVKSNTSVDVTVAKTNGIENPATAKLANVYTQDVGTLTVTKTFEGLEDDEIEALLEEMTIIVTDLEDEDAEPLELELDAQNGKYTASVQLPVGSYNVKESGADVDGYALETTYGNPGADGADNGTAATKREANEPTGADVGDQEPQGITVEVVENEIAEVVVTNTYTPVTGWLVITKEFEGLPEGVIPEKLSFTIAGPEGFGQGGKRTVAYTDFENGEYPIEVPVGTYTITENNTEVEDYFLIQTVEVEAEVEVTEKNTKEAPAVASFLNEYDYGGMGGGGDAKLVIQKVIVGDDVMPAEALFTVTGPKNYTIKYADFADNAYTIEYDVLPGDYTVTESGAEAEGYTLTVTGNNETKAVVEDQTTTFTITNTYKKNATPTPPGPVNPEPPVLNKKDHFAYIIGSTDGLVHPADPITRAEVATIFFRLLTDDSRASIWTKENDFSDVSIDDWFNNAVSTMANGGILKGYPDGTFGPKLSITRAEFATIAVRFFKDLQVKVPHFSDTKGHWAEAYINMAADQGLINGYPDDTYRPDAPITRAEAMTIINRLLERHPHKDRLLRDMIEWPDNMNPDVWYYADVQEATNSHEYTMSGGYETWTDLLPVRDWAAFETAWSTAYSARGGEVIGSDRYQSGNVNGNANGNDNGSGAAGGQNEPAPNDNGGNQNDGAPSNGRN